ncbi:hypothetical protein QBC44DRAFT_366762 [Cladorrhinum sp. PSN332]|nr:hypothetical protein QBC44DRAFT_366762 [Cladorrhinum sp. PSN332]
MTTTTAAAVPALTTTFVAPESCLVSYSMFLYLGSSTSCYEHDNPSLQRPCFFLHLGPATNSSQCLPPSHVPVSSFYYSPGICPSGYELACSSTSGDETRGTCCPSLYDCLMTPPTWWPWYSTDLCTTSMAQTVTFVYAVTTVGVVGWQTSTSTAGAANAFGIPIRFKASDLASSTSSSSTLDTTATPAAVADSAGFSAGAKAGVAVGVIFVVLVAVAVSFWLMRRRRRQPALTAAVGADANPQIELEGLSCRVELSDDRRNVTELQ